jgi:uncharacterized membrane protein
MVHPNLIVAVKTITLLMGALITYFAYRAYQRTEERALGALAVGFGIVTIGALLAGLADLVLGAPQLDALLVESALTAVGFAVILYSLYAE